MAESERLLFVYNADSGLLNAVKDVWHRTTRPSTYPCQLCKITYGASGMRRDWRDFTASLDVAVTFLHRDEFQAKYGMGSTTGVALPTALLERGDRLLPVVEATAMAKAHSVDDLQALVNDGLDRTRRADR